MLTPEGVQDFKASNFAIDKILAVEGEKPSPKRWKNNNKPKLWKQRTSLIESIIA